MARNTNVHRPGWVAGWVLLSMLGFALGFGLVFIGGWFAVEAVTGDAERILDDGWGFHVQLTAGFTLAGAGWATGQWLLLRRRVDHAGRWVLGGAVGFMLVAALYLLLYERTPLVVNEVVHNLIGGAALGVIQVPVVRRLTGRSGAWVALTAPLMVLGGTLAAGLRSVGFTDDVSGPLVVGVMALGTGIVLSRWMASPSPAHDSVPSEHRTLQGSVT